MLSRYLGYTTTLASHSPQLESPGCNPGLGRNWKPAWPELGLGWHERSVNQPRARSHPGDAQLFSSRRSSWHSTLHFLTAFRDTRSEILAKCQNGLPSTAHGSPSHRPHTNSTTQHPFSSSPLIRSHLSQSIPPSPTCTQVSFLWVSPGLCLTKSSFHPRNLRLGIARRVHHQRRFGMC